MSVVMKARPDRQSIYELERASIRAFVASCSGLFVGDVLDFGCGLAPYRDIVERAGARWHGYDHPANPGSVLAYMPDSDFIRLGEQRYIVADSPFSHGERYHAALATQVIQYLTDPPRELRRLRSSLWPDGALVITGPGCWHEEEPTSLWRWTRTGARTLLEQAGFHVERLEDRGTVDVGGFPISVGWGAVARA